MTHQLSLHQHFFIKMAGWKVTTTTLGLSQKLFFYPNVHTYAHICWQNPVSVQCRYVCVYIREECQSKENCLSIKGHHPSIYASSLQSHTKYVCLCTYVDRDRVAYLECTRKPTENTAALAILGYMETAAVSDMKFCKGLSG